MPEHINNEKEAFEEQGIKYPIENETIKAIADFDKAVKKLQEVSDDVFERSEFVRRNLLKVLSNLK